MEEERCSDRGRRLGEWVGPKKERERRNDERSVPKEKKGKEELSPTLLCKPGKEGEGYQRGEKSGRGHDDRGEGEGKGRPGEERQRQRREKNLFFTVRRGARKKGENAAIQYSRKNVVSREKREKKAYNLSLITRRSRGKKKRKIAFIRARVAKSLRKKERPHSRSLGAGEREGRVAPLRP